MGDQLFHGPVTCYLFMEAARTDPGSRASFLGVHQLMDTSSGLEAR